MPVSFIDNFKEISSVGISQGRNAEVVNDQDIGFGEFIHDFSITAVIPGKSHLIIETGAAQIETVKSITAGLVSQGTGQEGFAHSGGTGNNNVLEVFDPVTGNEPHHDGLINTPLGFIINVFYTCREFEFCIFKIALHPAVFFPVPLSIDDHRKAILEGKIIHFWLLKL